MSKTEKIQILTESIQDYIELLNQALEDLKNELNND